MNHSIDSTFARRYTLCMETRLRAVILDFGGVLGLPQDPDREKAMVSLRCAPSMAEFRALYEPGRLAMDRGTLSMQDYWSELLRECGVTPTAELIRRINGEDLLGWTRANTRMRANYWNLPVKSLAEVT